MDRSLYGKHGDRVGPRSVLMTPCDPLALSELFVHCQDIAACYFSLLLR